MDENIDHKPGIDETLGMIMRQSSDDKHFPVSMEDRRALNLSKLIGIIWFEAASPIDQYRAFNIYVNRDFSLEVQSINVEELRQLSDKSLEYLCDRMSLPDWMKRDRGIGPFRYAVSRKV